MSRLEPRSKPSQDRSKRRVDFILDTAETLVLEHGYEAVTALLISKETNISPGVLYHYFPGKYGIFAAVAKRAFAKLEICMRDVYSEVSTDVPYDRLFDRIVDALVIYWRENKAAILMWQAMEHAPQMDPVTEILKEKAIERNSVMIRTYLPDLPKSRVRIKAIMMEEICFSLLRQTYFLNKRDSLALTTEIKDVLKHIMQSG